MLKKLPSTVNIIESSHHLRVLNAQIGKVALHHVDRVVHRIRFEEIRRAAADAGALMLLLFDVNRLLRSYLVLNAQKTM